MLTNPWKGARQLLFALLRIVKEFFHCIKGKQNKSSRLPLQSIGHEQCKSAPNDDKNINEKFRQK